MGGSGDWNQLNLGAMFLLGLLGSGHCVGMCGPLILAFPARRGGWAAHVAYNAGRVATYTLVGIVLGGIGAGIALLAGDRSLIWTARIQVGLSLLAAVFLALFGLTKLGFVKEPAWLSLANPAKIPGFRRVQSRLMGKGPAGTEGAGGSAGAKGGRGAESGRGGAGNDAPGGGVGSLILLGLFLGLLPCGLSFAAFARALGAGGPIEGGLMTLSFGVGTLPSLLLLGVSASRLTARHRRVSDLIAGMLMIGMAVALVLEAMAAG